jgi:hypothetical protein
MASPSSKSSTAKTQKIQSLAQQVSLAQLPSISELRAAKLHQLPDLWGRFEYLLGPLPACNVLARFDRFYLLTVVLRRKDCLHDWLYARCREVESNPDGYLDLWAREHYKSTIITFAGVIQEVLKDPEITIGIFSHTKSISRDFLAQIKQEFEANTVLHQSFPDIFWTNPKRDSPSWSLDGGITVKRKSNPKECTIEGHGLVDGQPTGKHFGLLVYDDVVVQESVGTPEQITKTTRSWELSDNLGSNRGRKWHIGTRYSFADTYEEIIKRGSVIPRIHAATHDGTIAGRPVFLSQEIWDRKVIDQGPATIACQMLQNPLEGRQSLFDIEDLQRYEIRPEILSVYVMVDPASSMKKDSDNTAIAVIGVDYAMNKYLLDGFNHKMKLEDRWQNVRAMYVKWRRAPGIQGVKVGYERYGATSDLEYFESRMKVEGPRFDIEELAWPREGLGSKVDRVQRLGPDFRSHRFYLPYDNTVNEAGVRGEPRYTTLQLKTKTIGYEYRVAKAIRRKDHEGNVYDLSEVLKNQAHFFPFGKKDLIDAVSRIYDMEATPPQYFDKEQSLEPEYT